MKYLCYILVIFLLTSINATSQTDTLPAYLKQPDVPPFSIQLPNGDWYNKTNLQNKPTLILYFSTDCGHCQTETEELVSRAKSLSKLQVVMITSRSKEEMTAFSDKYMLHKVANIKVGSDTKRFITRFYKVKFTPFSALYNKKGKLVKVYESGIDFEDLLVQIK
jgi:cytochrome oxidase Cu insertion factor (SCO1/SenC/PrrC family)